MEKKIVTSYLLLLSFAFILASCGADKDASQNTLVETGDTVNGKSISSKNKISHSVVAIVIERAGGQALCTGSLISLNTILTAAHCVEDGPKNIQVLFTTDIHKIKKTMEIKRDVDSYVLHPNWGRHLKSGEGDLAIIHFKGNLPDGYAPLKLADENFVLKIGQKIVMAGFGVTDGGPEQNAGKLRQASSEVMGPHTETEVLIDGKKSSACFGDSGGPAFIKVDNELVQWGVASAVSRRSCDDLSIHTEVMLYKKWIDSIIKKF